MGEKSRKLAFALAIYKTVQKDGTVDFKILADNKEVPDEIMLMMVRHWSKTMENIYQENLPSKFLL